MAAPSIVTGTVITGTVANDTSASISYDRGTDANSTIFVVFVSSNLAGSGFSATFNGDPFTFPSLSNTNLTCRYMFLSAPASGSHTFVLTFGGTGNCAYALFTLKDSAQVSPIDMDESANGSSTAPAVSGTTVTNECFVVGAVAAGQNPTVDGSGFAQEWEVLQNIYNNGETKTQVTASAETASWSKAAGAWDAIIFGVKPAGAVVSTRDARSLSLLGVG